MDRQIETRALAYLDRSCPSAATPMRQLLRPITMESLENKSSLTRMRQKLRRRYTTTLAVFVGI